MKTESTHPQWHRVSSLKPRLRPHISFHRHIYRSQRWYVIHDESSARSHRFSPEALSVIHMIDGSTDVQGIYNKIQTVLGERAPNQDEFIRLLKKLHGNDLVLFDNTVNTSELLERQSRFSRFKKVARWWSPLSLRFPLFDPDRLLEHVLPLVKGIFNRYAFISWLIIVAMAATAGFVHWNQLTNNITDAVLAPDNLIILLLVYPVVKTLHEIGHALAIKVWGGEVHEIGIMLLVLIPVPYVEASAANAFPKKRQRIIVDAAGIIVELFLASLALLVWLNIEPGLVRSIAYNVILIGSVSTLFFNGNPLLRFDGYYILSDWIEIPNLAKRSTAYIGYLIQKYIFRINRSVSPVTAQGEASWMLFYGIAAFCYRMFIATTIILFIAGQYFFIGIALAVWAVFTMLLQPLLKQLRYLFTSNLLAENRLRAVSLSFVMVATVVSLLLFVPVSSWTNAEGIVWMPEKSQIRPKVSGFIKQVSVPPGTIVIEGDLLFETDDPLVLAEKRLQQYRLKELQARYNALSRTDQTEAQLIKEQIGFVKAQLEQTKERMAFLSIKSPVSGQVIIPDVNDLEGQYVEKGKVIAYVVDYPINSIRAVVTQDDIGKIRNGINRVSLLFANRLDSVYEASLIRDVPAATQYLPSAALGRSGGGSIPVEPGSTDGRKAFESVFLFDLELDDSIDPRFIGERVYIRFEHDPEPVAAQLYRRVRQLFLRRFDV